MSASLEVTIFVPYGSSRRECFSRVTVGITGAAAMDCEFSFGWPPPLRCMPWLSRFAHELHVFLLESMWLGTAANHRHRVIHWSRFDRKQ